MHQGDGAREPSLEKGYDPVYDVMPQKRVIQRALKDRLPEMILVGDFEYGNSAAESVGASCLV